MKIRRAMLNSRDHNHSVLNEAWRLVLNNRITLMGFLRRISYTNASYLETRLGPFPIGKYITLMP